MFLSFRWIYIQQRTIFFNIRNFTIFLLFSMQASNNPSDIFFLKQLGISLKHINSGTGIMISKTQRSFLHGKTVQFKTLFISTFLWLLMFLCFLTFDTVLRMYLCFHTLADFLDRLVSNLRERWGQNLSNPQGIEWSPGGFFRLPSILFIAHKSELLFYFSDYNRTNCNNQHFRDNLPISILPQEHVALAEKSFEDIPQVHYLRYNIYRISIIPQNH